MRGENYKKMVHQPIHYSINIVSTSPWAALRMELTTRHAITVI